MVSYYLIRVSLDVDAGGGNDGGSVRDDGESGEKEGNTICWRTLAGRTAEDAAVVLVAIAIDGAEWHSRPLRYLPHGYAVKIGFCWGL